MDKIQIRRRGSRLGFRGIVFLGENQRRCVVKCASNVTNLVNHNKKNIEEMSSHNLLYAQNMFIYLLCEFEILSNITRLKHD